MRSRKNSDVDISGVNSDKPTASATDEEKEDEFSKPMMYLYDLEELNQRKKE